MNLKPFEPRQHHLSFQDRIILIASTSSRGCSRGSRHEVIANAVASAIAYAIALAPASAIAIALAIVFAGAKAFALAFARAFANAYATAYVRASALALANGGFMKLGLHFAKGYIAHPYWPELERIINIQKESGTKRARSEQNRAKALSEYLLKIGMSLDDYLELEKLAERQFYTAADVERMTFGAVPVDGYDPAEIVIPPHQIYGCLVQAADLARSNVRVAPRDQIRSTLIVAASIRTGKTAGDGVWERFAVVTAGTGAKLSNQRALRRNGYLGPFDATLTIDFDPSLVAPERVRDFVAFAGREIGIGASRKLGWGRFSLT